MHKALSAAEACRALNSGIQVETHLEAFTPANAGACRAGRVTLGCARGVRSRWSGPGVAAGSPRMPLDGATRYGGAPSWRSGMLVQPLSLRVNAGNMRALPAPAVQLVAQYDVVVDGSDNAPTRYLIRWVPQPRRQRGPRAGRAPQGCATAGCKRHLTCSTPRGGVPHLPAHPPAGRRAPLPALLRSDACCAAGRPLVSGAAIGTDGQLTVYCHGEDGASGQRTGRGASLLCCSPACLPAC